MGAERDFALWVLNALAALGAVGVFLLSGCPRDMSMLGALRHFASGFALSCWYFFVGAERHFALWVLNALVPLGAVGVFLLCGCPRDMSMLGALRHFASGCALSCWYFSADMGNHRTLA